MERLTDIPKVPQLRWGALSDSPQALTNLCALFTTLQSCLSNTDSSRKGKTHIQSTFPHTWVHRLQRWGVGQTDDGG